MGKPKQIVKQKEQTTDLQKFIYGDNFDINETIQENDNKILINTSKEKKILESKKPKKVTKKKKVAKKKTGVSTGMWRSIKRKWGWQNAAELEEDRLMKSRGELALEKSEINERINKFKALSDEQGDMTNANVNKLIAENAEWDAGLEEQEREALFMYKSQNDSSVGYVQGPDYRSMNRVLRSDGYSKDEDTTQLEKVDDVIEKVKKEEGFEKLEKDEQNAKLIAGMTKTKEVHTAINKTVSAINKSELKKDTALYRYVGLDTLGVILGEKWGTKPKDIDKKLSEINKGKRIVQDKAFLSTTAFRDAASAFKGRMPVEIRILAHKGTKGAYIPALKSKDGEGANAMALEEQEMLLQGGTQMRVLKVEKKAYFGSGIPEYNKHDAERADIFDDMDERLEELTEETLKQAGVLKTDDRLTALNKLADYELMKRYGENKGYIVYMETIDTKPLINR